jgi:HEPN domain-containing protein
MKTNTKINPPVYIQPTYIDVEKRLQRQLDIKIKTTKNQLSDGRAWLEDAKKTLDSAKLIIQNNPCDALYTWCHAVEKMAKAYGLITGTVTTEELKNKIGHITPNIGINLVNKVELEIPLAEYTNDLFYHNFKSYTEIIKYRDKKTKIRPYQKYMTTLSNEDFEELLKFCEETDNDLKKEFDSNKIYYAYRDNHYGLKFISDVYTVLKRFDKDNILKLIDTILESSKLSPIFFHPRMQIVCLISSSYLEISKYPIEHKELLNDNSYILKTLDRLNKISEDLILKLYDLANIIETTD